MNGGALNLHETSLSEKAAEEAVTDVASHTGPENKGPDLESAIAELRGVVDTMKPGSIASGQTKDNGSKRICGDSFWSIAVDIQAVLGTTELTVRELLELESGQVLPLDRGLDEPLELVVNGRVIATAELEKDDRNRLSFRVIELLDTTAGNSTD